MEKKLIARGLERIRQQIDERQFQIFDLNVTKGWSPKKVAATLGITAPRVYFTKHRVSALLKREIQRMEREVNRGGAAYGQRRTV